MNNINIYNNDCYEIIDSFDDFDLTVLDPPFQK